MKFTEHFLNQPN